MIKASILCLILFCPLAIATGPSWIRAEITPISINADGEILCRTRYEQNPTGGHDFMPVEYGLLVITHHQLIEYPIYHLAYPKADDQAQFIQLSSSYDEQFYRCQNDTMSLQEQAIHQQFGFSECNVDPYMRNIVMPQTELEQQKNIDLSHMALLGLKNGKAYWSTEIEPNENNLLNDHLSNNSINVIYDFGHVLFIGYNRDDLSDGNTTNIVFDYNSGITFMTEDGEQDIGFDIEHITGILLLK